MFLANKKLKTTFWLKALQQRNKCTIKFTIIPMNTKQAGIKLVASYGWYWFNLDRNYNYNV